MRTFVLVLVLLVAWSVVRPADSAAPPPRCATGEARGFAVVKPFPVERAGQIPGTFTHSEHWFLRRYNCTGHSVEIRRLATGVYDMRFPGLRVRVVTGSAISETQISISMQPLADIARVRLFSGNQPDDAAFSVVVY